MSAPHGGTLVNRIVEGKERDTLVAKAGGLPAIAVDPWALSDIEMIAIGGFSPLEGFLGKADYESVVHKRRLANGLVWTIPVTLAVDAKTADGLQTGSDVALTNNGQVVAILHLQERYEPDKALSFTGQTPGNGQKVLHGLGRHKTTVGEIAVKTQADADTTCEPVKE